MLSQRGRRSKEWRNQVKVKEAITIRRSEGRVRQGNEVIFGGGGGGGEMIW